MAGNRLIWGRPAFALQMLSPDVEKFAAQIVPTIQ